MDIFDILSLIGGLCLFLFGMDAMSDAVSDHCANVAGCLIDLKSHDLNSHALLRSLKAEDGTFRDHYTAYTEKYALI